MNFISVLFTPVENPSPSATSRRNSSSFLETLSRSASHLVPFPLLAVLQLSTAAHVKLGLEHSTSIFFPQPHSETNSVPLQTPPARAHTLPNTTATVIFFPCRAGESGSSHLLMAQSLNEVFEERCLVGAVQSFCKGDQIATSLGFGVRCKTRTAFSQVCKSSWQIWALAQTDLAWFIFCLKLCPKLWLSKVSTKPLNSAWWSGLIFPGRWEFSLRKEADVQKASPQCVKMTKKRGSKGNDV